MRPFHNTASRESYIWPTAISSWTIPRTKPSPRLAMPGTRSKEDLVVQSRELYFATYQSIAKDENRRPGLYKEFAPDFFDLIIVDECHRGSAKEDSNWRDILEYFKPAYQLGMTATPLRDDNRDTYLYFGNPIYTYSLKQGIDDGFLAPYRVLSHRHAMGCRWLATEQGRPRPIRPRNSRRGLHHV
jgi:hypothetical protein